MRWHVKCPDAETGDILITVYDVEWDEMANVVAEAERETARSVRSYRIPAAIRLLLFGPVGAVVFAAVGGTGALFGSDWARHQLDKVLVSKWIRSLDGPAVRTGKRQRLVAANAR